MKTDKQKESLECLAVENYNDENGKDVLFHGSAYWQRLSY